MERGSGPAPRLLSLGTANARTIPADGPGPAFLSRPMTGPASKRAVKRPWVVAIDGPAGSGKSTIARTVAHRLGYQYVDTGAMYRALTWKALQNGTSFESPAALAALARRLPIRFVTRHDGHRVLVGREDVTDRIRTERVSQMTSRLAAVGAVRRVLQRRQRELGRRGRVVMEGRDIGTAVFPESPVKIYLDASPLERARRRYRQLKAKGHRVNLAAIAADIRRRDERDRSRGMLPLAAAPDAVVLDSTRLAPQDVVKIVLDQVRAKRS
jgi:CMP/dCMP kinase